MGKGKKNKKQKPNTPTNDKKVNPTTTVKEKVEEQTVDNWEDVVIEDPEISKASFDEKVTCNTSPIETDGKNYTDTTGRDHKANEHKGKGARKKEGSFNQKSSDYSKKNERSYASKPDNSYEVPPFADSKQKYKKYNKDVSNTNIQYNYAGFKEFVKTNKLLEFKQLIEEEGDLFSYSDEYSLAHCVAEDLNMNAGIAIHFRYN